MTSLRGRLSLGGRFFQDLDLLAGVRPFSTENVFQGSYTRTRACAPATSQPEKFFQLVSVRAEKDFPDEKGRSTRTRACAPVTSQL